MKVALIVLTMLLTACCPPSEKTKPLFTEGTIVRDKLTKQRGIIIHVRRGVYDLRLENGDNTTFREYELEKDQN